jgi:hypothetical protein
MVSNPINFQKQSPFTFHLNPLSKKKTRTYEVENPGSNLGQAKNVAGLLSKSKK